MSHHRPNKIKFRIELQDAGAGLGYQDSVYSEVDNQGFDESLGGGEYTDKIYFGNIDFKGPSDQTIYLSLNSGDLISGDLNHGIFEKTITLNSLTEPGTWRLANYYLSDRAGNYSSLADSVRLNTWSMPRDSEEVANLKTQLLADALGIEASSLIGEITSNSLTNNTPEDISGPELLNFSLSKNAVDVSGGAQEITLEVELKDLGLGLGDTNQGSFYTDQCYVGGGYESMGGGSSTDTIEYIGGITLIGPKSQRIDVPLTSEDLESGDLNQGIFRKTFSISPDAEPGTWRLANYYLNDKAGNHHHLQMS